MAQPRQKVAIQATETIRNRLGLNHENFSEALGLHPSTYGGYVTKGDITKTAALAAEALMRRQQASGEIADEVFVLRIIKGVPTVFRIGELRRMTLDGTEYFLLPTSDSRI